MSTTRLDGSRGLTAGKDRQILMVKYPAERVPMPEGKSEGFAASVRALKIGESFLVPTSDLKKYTRKVIHREAVRMDKPVSIRKVEDGLRVFRLASWPKRKGTKEMLKQVEKENLPEGAAQSKTPEPEKHFTDTDDWGA